MKVTWIVENYTKEPSFEALCKSIESSEHSLIKINGDYNKKLIRDRFPHYLNCLGEAFYHPQQCVLVNGSISMCKIIKNELCTNSNIIKGAWPILYSDFPKYKCSAYYSHFGSCLFNDKYCLMSLKELERQKFDVWGQYGKNAMIFVRPDSGEKTFQAGLLDFLDLDTFVKKNQDCLHDLVLISTPKNIVWEGRVICSKNKEIIAHSTYMFQNQITKVPAIPEGAKKLVDELFKIDYYPDSVFCYDLCEDSDGNFYLLELTSFSSAGIYSCNTDSIVKKVSEIAWEDFKNYGQKPSNIP
jgi:hypothetical protein